MQPAILLISLLLMAVAALFYCRAIFATAGPPANASTNKRRNVLLWALTIFGVILSVATLREWPHKSPGTDAIIVNISGGQWWWDTDTVEIPLGREVAFKVTTEDVTHGMGIYTPDMRLVAQVQAMPGYTNTLVHTFDEQGTYRILCMEYCGVAHHDMVNEFEVVEAN